MMKMMSVRSSASTYDIESLEKAARMLGGILDEYGPLLGENCDITKNLVAFNIWLNRAVSGDPEAAEEIRGFGGELLEDAAKEARLLAEDQQRIEDESPLLAEEALVRGMQFFEVYGKLAILRRWMKKHGLVMRAKSADSVPARLLM